MTHMDASAGTRSKWKERIAAWQASGQSAASFAEGKGYQGTSLQRWVAQFRVEEAAVGAAQFYKLVATEPVTVAVVKAKPVPVGLTLELGDVRICVEEGFSPTLLAAVVSALSARKDGEK